MGILQKKCRTTEKKALAYRGKAGQTTDIAFLALRLGVDLYLPRECSRASCCKSFGQVGTIPTLDGRNRAIPFKKLLALWKSCPPKQLKSNPQSRFPVERHTGNLLLGFRGSLLSQINSWGSGAV